MTVRTRQRRSNRGQGSGITVENRAALRENRRRMQEYKIAMQKSIAQYLDLVRVTAAEDEIIPNTTGFLNPFMARKRQPSKSNKLTSRTGKLKWALKEKASQDPTKEWKGFGRKLVKLNIAAMNLLVRAVKKGELDEYIGTMRVHVNYMPPRLTSMGTAPSFDDRGQQQSRGFRPRWMPRETKKTIFFRFMHELGIRGRRRPFLDPASRRVLRQLSNVVDSRIAVIWR